MGEGETTAVRADPMRDLAIVLLVWVMLAGLFIGQVVVPVAVGAWVGAWWCRRYTSSLEEKKKGVGHHLCSAGFLYLVPIAVALTLWAALALSLQAHADAVSTGSLMTMEQIFGAVSRFFSQTIKLSEVWVFVLLLVVYLGLTALLVLTRGRPRVVRIARGVDIATTFYTRYSGPVAAGLGMLAALSLFGMAAGSATQDVSLRLIVARQGYADVSRRVEAAITGQVTHDLYVKITSGMPDHWRQAFESVGDIDREIDAMRSDLDAAHGFGIPEPGADDVVAAQTARNSTVDALPRDDVLPAEAHALPDDVTPAQVRDAAAATSSLPPPPEVEVEMPDGRRKVVLQIEKIVTERLVAMMKPLTQAVPALDPVFQTFQEAADSTLQEQIGKAYDRVMRTAVEQPDRLGAVAGDEASRAVAETDLSGPLSRAAPAAERAADDMDATLARARDAGATVARDVNARKTADAAAADRAARSRGLVLDLIPLLRLRMLPYYYRGPEPSVPPPSPGEFGDRGSLTDPVDPPSGGRPVEPAPPAPEIPEIPFF